MAVLQKAATYQEAYQSFQWEIPERYNIGVDACDKWAHTPDELALIYLDENWNQTHYTRGQLLELSNRLANALSGLGVERGDRVGILLPQCPETALSHLAAYKLGGIAVPLFTLFGPEALEYRLNNSGCKALVTDGANVQKVLDIKERLPQLELIIQEGEPRPGCLDFYELIQKASPDFTAVDTSCDDPALIIYTSGTTGPPKGALHAHRTLLGHLPGVEFPHNFFPQPDDCFWTPADWAWAGGLLDVLLPSLVRGVPVIAHRFKKFDPEQAFKLMAEFKVKNSFLPPTALKIMRQVPRPRERFGFNLRSAACAGEPMGAELYNWGKEELGLEINEFYGQTEINLLVATCADCMEIKPGSMGLPVPGHLVDILNEKGERLPTGSEGEVALKTPDPVAFLEYWQNPQATREKFLGDWCLTGDLAYKDADGYLWFRGRNDDLITSAGYRIGPAEIEDCLLKHPAVAMAAVVGAPDKLRGTIVKAFVVPRPSAEIDQELYQDIQGFVKTRLAAHEYPREIEFVNELPMTATGKIKRNVLRGQEAGKD
jgi:acetyl-CoA synthetase